MFGQLNAEFQTIKTEISANKIFTQLINAKCRLIIFMITLWAKEKFGDVIACSSSPLAFKFQTLYINSLRA